MVMRKLQPIPKPWMPLEFDWNEDGVLQNACAARRISVADLAQKISVSPSILSRYQQDESSSQYRLPNPDVIKKIEEVLEVTFTNVPTQTLVKEPIHDGKVHVRYTGMELNG
jgi:transcriptional regulator with XRE-family HTH domain